ncbi:MAG: UDP-N-acetylmuramoyl-L-alanine--D-glutamate ligase [Candidatus Kapabacteria bacterium]|nr:UDP-N-acetylmuramoyl-L-alanine--D-glutamate ligase [Candidatus Kapabacteria bacterium]
MNVLIIGASMSGHSAAILAKKLGYSVFVSELDKTEKFSDAIKEFNQYNISYEMGKNSIKNLDSCNIVITSPGVPRDAPILIEATNRGIPIISEIEFAYQHCNNPIIAITGTNGKTTTTALIEYILNRSGVPAVAAGNIGKPLSEVVSNLEPGTVVVLEISSYQLDRIEFFHPNIAIITNITPDHLKYHKTMEDYIATKWKIASNQIPEDLLILNFDDEYLSKGNPNVRSRIEYFSVRNSNCKAFVRDGKIIIRQHKEEELMNISELAIPGVHNVYNSLAAIIAANAIGISNTSLKQALMTFQGVNHRLEFVRILNGIKFINDSKATNVNSTIYALDTYSEPIVWIAGGRGDNNDYSKLDDLVFQKVKKIICIGEEAEAIYKHFNSIKPAIICQTFPEAIWEAYESAEPGDIVLFSPACKSFDMFNNFEHRGDVFKEIVNKLI